jgi:hypothetical protein
MFNRAGGCPNQYGVFINDISWCTEYYYDAPP